jgi:hypothetical protein
MSFPLRLLQTQMQTFFAIKAKLLWKVSTQNYPTRFQSANNFK